MIITVASGKGGTGKTLVATSIAVSLGRVMLADCDVEEPNSYLFFPERELLEETECTVMVPVVDQEKCTRCGACSDFCPFNALAVLPQEVLLFGELCHGCGGCIIACPEGAVSEGSRTIGKVYRARSGEVELIWGDLNPGEARATPLIRSVREKAVGEMVIVDSPPGASCPVIEAVRGSDFCLLVTEPTPFGLYDLDIALRVLEKMEIPSGVVVNKAGLGNRAVYDYCEEKGVPVLMEIPMSREIASLYSKGKIFAEEMPEWKPRFADLVQRIKEMVR